MIRDATDFLIHLRNARARYTAHYGPLISAIRKRYAESFGGPVPAFQEQALEAHVRAYYINALLSALNWRLNSNIEDGLPSLVPETPLKSAAKGTVRFLDYLGMECHDDKPLMIVETKSPGVSLPRFRLGRRGDEYKNAAQVICDGLSGAKLVGNWNDWLGTVRDYVVSLWDRSGHYPARVVLTNGEWLIIFADVAKTVLSSSPDAAGIRVLPDFEALEDSSAEVFQLLNYQAVASAAPSLRASELGFRTKTADVDAIMHGLRLLYAEHHTFKVPGMAAHLEVRPILFVHTRWGNWLRVESESAFEIPHDRSRLPLHLADVTTAASALMDEIHQVLDDKPSTRGLIDHYSDSAFATLAGVTEDRANRDIRSTQYLVVTGRHTHFLLLEPLVPDCPFHRWAANRGTAGPEPVQPVYTARVRGPRSFFFDGEPHHCAHFSVVAAKSSQITAENRPRCGSRSGDDGDAFCEIAPFEQCLCCRACAFMEACESTEVFHLPCKAP